MRERFSFSCGYCGVSETEVGGELTVDHFNPISAGGNDDDSNLIYACVRCNQYKGALQPEYTNRDLQQRLLHPLIDDLSVHLRVHSDLYLLEAITEAGKFQIRALQLNRPQLIALREKRALMKMLEQRVEIAETEQRLLLKRLLERDEYIVRLEARLRQSTQNEPDSRY